MLSYLSLAKKYMQAAAAAGHVCIKITLLSLISICGLRGREGLPQDVGRFVGHDGSGALANPPLFAALSRFSEGMSQRPANQEIKVLLQTISSFSNLHTGDRQSFTLLCCSSRVRFAVRWCLGLPVCWA